MELLDLPWEEIEGKVADFIPKVRGVHQVYREISNLLYCIIYQYLDSSAPMLLKSYNLEYMDINMFYFTDIDTIDPQDIKVYFMSSSRLQLRSIWNSIKPKLENFDTLIGVDQTLFLPQEFEKIFDDLFSDDHPMPRINRKYPFIADLIRLRSFKRQRLFSQNPRVNPFRWQNCRVGSYLALDGEEIYEEVVKSFLAGTDVDRELSETLVNIDGEIFGLEAKESVPVSVEMMERFINLVISGSFPPLPLIGSDHPGDDIEIIFKRPSKN